MFVMYISIQRYAHPHKLESIIRRLTCHHYPLPADIAPTVICYR